jgi:hypothetical protein
VAFEFFPTLVDLDALGKAMTRRERANEITIGPLTLFIMHKVRFCRQMGEHDGPNLNPIFR